MVQSDMYMIQKVPATIDQSMADSFLLPYRFNWIQKNLSDWLADGRSHNTVMQNYLIFSWYVGEFSFKNVAKSCLVNCIRNDEFCFYLINLPVLFCMHGLLHCPLPFKHATSYLGLGFSSWLSQPNTSAGRGCLPSTLSVTVWFYCFLCLGSAALSQPTQLTNSSEHYTRKEKKTPPLLYWAEQTQ